MPELIRHYFPNCLLDAPWYWWALIALCMLIVFLFEGSYRVTRSLIADASPSLARKYRTDDVKPTRDVWLTEAIWRAYLGKWVVPAGGLVGMDRGEGEKKIFSDIVSRFRQLAFDGDLPIWAKTKQSDIWDCVDAKFWKEYKIDYAIVSEDGLIVEKESKPPWKKNEPIPYRHFMTSKAAIESIYSGNK